jgi:hypothetical protein
MALVLLLLSLVVASFGYALHRILSHGIDCRGIDGRSGRIASQEEIADQDISRGAASQSRDAAPLLSRSL